MKRVYLFGVKDRYFLHSAAESNTPGAVLLGELKNEKVLKFLEGLRWLDEATPGSMPRLSDNIHELLNECVSLAICRKVGQD